MTIQPLDDRRNFVIFENTSQAIQFAADHFLGAANRAIKAKGAFYVALSGGSSPKAIFEQLLKHKEACDFTKVWLFWGDERAVPPDHPESNYKMAMETAFSTLPVPKEQIFRMQAEKSIEKNALSYEKMIQKTIPDGSFDLLMLGMGEDGHTASLFPNTNALKRQDRLVVANFIPQKNQWRMTLTFPCINAAKEIVIYVFGKGKAKKLNEVFTTPFNPDEIPIQAVGTPDNPALFILDQGSGQNLVSL
ncbi:MAG: 6-phosphogluconolactonase [Waddliaceae bacterium]